MAHYLVTGGAGFLGINLVRHLLAKGQEVSSLDFALFDYPEANEIEIHQGDIRNSSVVEAAVSKAQIVVHTAAALPLYKDHDILTTDVDGTRNILEASLRSGVERVIHISSTAVYGVPNRHPLYETDPLMGVGSYGNAKIAAEQLCLDYRAKGMCVPIIRPKSFVGPERLGVFAILYDWASDGRSFPILGNGLNKYQLLDVEDLCQAIWLAATRPPVHTNDTFNIGAREFGTIGEDYQAVLNEAGFGKRIRTLPAPPIILILRLMEKFGISPLYKWVYETVAKDSFVSTKKAETSLGFDPRYSNQEALVRNYRWYLENLDAFRNVSGVSHRVPWKQGVLSLAKWFF